jgi:hypothetical protein
MGAPSGGLRPRVLDRALRALDSATPAGATCADVRVQLNRQQFVATCERRLSARPTATASVRRARDREPALGFAATSDLANGGSRSDRSQRRACLPCGFTCHQKRQSIRYTRGHSLRG